MQPKSEAMLRTDVGGFLETLTEHGKPFQAMHAAAESLRVAYRDAEGRIIAAAGNDKLSPEGVKEEADNAVANFNAQVEGSARLQTARKVVADKRSELKGAGQHTAPEEPQDLQVASDIRARIAAAQKPYEAAQKHLGDPTVMGAILSAHALASGLTPDQHKALVQHAAHAADPKSTEELDLLDRAEARLDSAVSTTKRLVQQAADLAVKEAHNRQTATAPTRRSVPAAAVR